MSISNTMPSRRSLLTIAALPETMPANGPVRDFVEAAQAGPQTRDATTPLFYILLGFIMLSLVLGLLP